MNLYIVYAIIAYLLFAGNGVADKFMLSKVLPKPVVYAFFVGIMSPLVLLLAPFGLHLLSAQNLFIALVAGVLFTFALYFFYSAIAETSISRILPIEGGFVPVFTLIFARILLGENLSTHQLAAFIFLVAGGILISLKKDSVGQWRPKALKNALIAAILFALSLTLMKYVYLQTNFISGIIWTRLGLGLGALSFLLSIENRKAIFRAPKETSRKNKFLFYGSHLMGTTGGLLQNYAIAIGSVTIVSALQGIQFVFVLILSLFFSLHYPNILKENISGTTILQKVFAIILISLGLYYLS